MFSMKSSLALYYVGLDKLAVPDNVPNSSEGDTHDNTDELLMLLYVCSTSFSAILGCIEIQTVRSKAMKQARFIHAADIIQLIRRQNDTYRRYTFFSSNIHTVASYSIDALQFLISLLFYPFYPFIID